MCSSDLRLAGDGQVEVVEGIVGSKHPQLPVPLVVEVSQGQLHVGHVYVGGGVDRRHVHVDQARAVADGTVFIRKVFLGKSTLILNGIKVSTKDLELRLEVFAQYLNARCSLVLMSLVAYSVLSNSSISLQAISCLYRLLEISM